MPSRQVYSETHSASNLLDFCRSNFRYRNAEQDAILLHPEQYRHRFAPYIDPAAGESQAGRRLTLIPQALQRYMHSWNE